MTIKAIMAVVLSMCAMIGVYFLILYFKIDNIKDKVDEIKRKMGEKKDD